MHHLVRLVDQEAVTWRQPVEIEIATIGCAVKTPPSGERHVDARHLLPGSLEMIPSAVAAAACFKRELGRHPRFG